MQAFAEWKSSLSVTNILSLLLQSDKKDFSAISCSVNTVLGTSKIMRENREINHLKNFNNADEIKNIGNYQKQNIVSSGIPKCQKQDHNLKVVSATFLLVCFVCLKERGLVKQGKMFFISLRMLFSFFR